MPVECLCRSKSGGRVPWRCTQSQPGTWNDYDSDVSDGNEYDSDDDNDWMPLDYNWKYIGYNYYSEVDDYDNDYNWIYASQRIMKPHVKAVP